MILDEHDITKNMLNTIRESIRPDKNGVIELSGDDRKGEEEKFRQIMGNRVEFTIFNLYPDADNVVFGGRFQDLDGLEFQMTLEESNGLYITANNLQLTPDAADRLKKLANYYTEWANEWAMKLNKEYKNQK